MTTHDAFIEHLNRASATVATWPEWKRNALSGCPPITLDECDKFAAHALNDAALLDSECHVAIQPHDLLRFCRTVRALHEALRALAVEMEEREQQRDAFFTAFTALPCRICGGKRNWQTDGQLQAVCHDCAHRTRAREGR